MRKLFLCLAAVAAFATGCDLIDLGADEERKELELSTKSSEFIVKGNDFSINLLESIDKSANGSYIMSPLSLQFVLGMILDGAQGQTADEICEVLGFGAGDVAAVDEYSKSLMEQLPKLDKKTTIKIANSIVVNKDYNLLSSYKKTVSNYYEAYVESVDFSNTASVVNKINNWCSRNTNGLIPEIIDNLPSNTIACLLNALYFKGKWDKDFEKSNTVEEDFTDEASVKSKVKMMKQYERFAYSWEDSFQTISLPYGNGAYSMVVMLPNDGHKISEIPSFLKKYGWDAFRQEFSYREVELWLPKFETTFEIELTDMLAKMGMPTAFTSAADFSLMAEAPLCIDLIKQKAIIKVDEQGSEAAAVTIGIAKATAAGPDPDGPVIFHADHPFLYFITEDSTGAILFAGRYSGSK